MTKQKFPEPTCGALIFNPEGKILLIKSHKWKNKYVIPGGHIELGEKIQEALKREVKEETGLDIFDVKLILFQEFIFGKSYWKKKHFIFFDFSCKTKSTKVKLNNEGQGYLWMDIKEALKLPVEPYTKRVIQYYLKKN